MPIEVGHAVMSPRKQEWGVGRVVDINEDKIRVHVGSFGLRILNTRYVQLEEVAVEQMPANAALQIDVESLADLCHQFIREMEGNRKTFDDAGVARKILEEIENHGALTRTTGKRLAAWCNTEGPVFQAGVNLAREISLTLYGRVLNEEEFA